MKYFLTVLAFAPSFLFGAHATAASLTVDCQQIRGYSSEQVSYFYYRVMETDGEPEAQRLWGAYHGLRGRCASTPRARATVSVSPAIAELAHAAR